MRVRLVDTERVEIGSVSGRVLAEAVRADRPSPAVDVSAMDGFAVRLSDTAGGELRVTGEIRIGQQPPAMPAGAALRIVTGAPVPTGADAVIKREDVVERTGSILINAEAVRGLRRGSNIRRQGENISAGGEVVSAGVVATPAVVGAMSSFGMSCPLVYRRVRVGIVSTGDEVIATDGSPTPWQLRDGNGPALGSMLSAREWLDVQKSVHAADEPDAIREAAENVLASCEVLLLTGGVSMGDRDFVPSVVRDLGAEVLFHRLSQRPGGPVLGAVLPDGRPVLGLPGNPLSVMVTGRRIVLPVLEHMAGFTEVRRMPSVAVANPDERRLGMWWFRMARVGLSGAAELVQTTSSGDIAALARSDGFVEIPPEQGGPGPWPFYGWSS